MASVIYNRLEAGMKLEMDPTREYINNYVTSSPYLSNTGKFAALYNTYKCSGLPAGPICNPGSRAIQAARTPLLPNTSISSLEMTTRTIIPKRMKNIRPLWKSMASNIAEKVPLTGFLSGDIFIHEICSSIP